MFMDDPLKSADQVEGHNTFGTSWMVKKCGRANIPSIGFHIRDDSVTIRCIDLVLPG
jgi:hypothetical protein